MAQEPTETQAPPEAPKIKMAASPLPPEEIYVDGVAGLFARPELVKLDCYRVVRIDADRAEVRTITHRLVLPIQSFRELATLAQNVTSGRRGAAPAAGAAGSGDGGAEEKEEPAYPWHSACGDVCSRYVLYEGVTVMGFKVASRVRGLSDEAFSGGLRYGGAVPLGAGPAALAGRLPLPLLRPSGALRAGGSGSLSMQPVQEADIAHGGHDLPRDQAAADTLVRRHPPDRDGEERHLVGGTRPPSRGQAADGLGREAQDHGGDGAARGGDGAYGGGSRWTTPISAGCAPAASGAAARRAKRPSRRRSRPVPRGARAS